MEFIELDTLSDFEYLEPGDIIIVKWTDYTIKHQQNIEKVKSYKILEHKKAQHEIICQLPENHYFNYMQFCLGRSGADEVYKVLI